MAYLQSKIDIGSTNLSSGRYPNPSQRVRFLGLDLNDVDGDGIVAAAVAAVSERRRLLIVNANAHMVVLANQQSWLCDLFSRADLAFCDGAGVQIGVRLLAGKLLARSTPPEWIDRLAASLPPGSSVFWLGGKPDVVSVAAERFASRHGLKTAGVQHGYFDRSPGSPENEALIARLNALQPDLLLVNMGMPVQERWLHDNWDRIDVRVALTAGALVDHIAGTVHRPPRWVANLGLEWLVRLLREPKRLWRRYLLGLPAFAMLMLRDLLRSHGLLRQSRLSLPRRAETTKY